MFDGWSGVEPGKSRLDWPQRGHENGAQPGRAALFAGAAADTDVSQYLVKRLLFALVVLFVISVVVFCATRLVPGDVCKVVLNTPDVDQQQCDAINKELGLDQPFVTQYLDWMGGIVTGDWGTTLISKRDVWSEIETRIPLTVELTLHVDRVRAGNRAANGRRLGDQAGPRNGLPAAHYRDRLAQHSELLDRDDVDIFPAKWWGYSPPPGYVDIWEDPLKNLEQLYLPAFALGLGLSASLARITRSSMLEVLRQDYIRTARAKGLSEQLVVLRHGLKNAMIPVTTLFGLQFGVLLGGTVVLESIFALPGLGTLVLSSVIINDYPQVQGLVLFFAAVLIMINLLVDISYAWFDRRIRYA